MSIFQLVVLWIGVLAVAFLAFKKTEAITIAIAAVLAAFAAIMTFISLRGKKTDNSGQPPQTSTGPDQNAGFYPFVLVPLVLSKPPLTFKRDSVEYRGTILNYNRINGIFYNTVKITINLIPTSQTFKYCIKGEDGKISINFASFFYIGNQKLQDAYLKMIEFAKIYVEPFIVAKIMKEIFEYGKTVKIGSVELSKNGYSKKKLFGGREEVLWTDKIYIPQYYEGRVYTYKVKNDKPKVFASLSMQTLNAVVLPMLVQACYNRTHPQAKA